MLACPLFLLHRDPSWSRLNILLALACLPLDAVLRVLRPSSSSCMPHIPYIKRATL